MSATLAASPPLSFLDQATRELFLRRLQSLSGGWLRVRDPLGDSRCGDADAPLHVRVEIRDPRFYRRVLLGGSLGAAESLIDGDWHCDDLTSLVRLFIRNLDLTDHWDAGLGAIRALAARIGHAFRRNTHRGSLRNIRAHYDLGNDFYQLMLDETLSYSCGFFERPETTLHEASLAKLRLVCDKLNLQPSDHLLEIGGGWGGLAIFAAENYGCRVTTTTISQEQFDLATGRVGERGLSDRVTILKQDYRDLRGSFDKLVSIEMIEAVGHEYFGTFFRQCASLLRPGGQMLMQAITIKEQRYREHLRRVDFIRKYIFPGGCLPSVLALGQAAASASDLQFHHLEDITAHYVRTLQHWRQRFQANLDGVRTLGYSEPFIRMWNYYLCYCEAAFAERQIQTVQLMFAKAGWQAARSPQQLTACHRTTRFD
jgi:cyclopropane-fatty-acyl-phospholipid synthase